MALSLPFLSSMLKLPTNLKLLRLRFDDNKSIQRSNVSLLRCVSGVIQSSLFNMLFSRTSFIVKKIDIHTFVHEPCSSGVNHPMNIRGHAFEKSTVVTLLNVGHCQNSRAG